MDCEAPTMEFRIREVESRVKHLEDESVAIRRILVGIAPEEIGGVRGDLLALKNKATLILVLVVFTFGLKIVDVLGWTAHIQSFVR